MDVWHFILERLDKGMDVRLLYVLESEGSSPGRRGFKMAVAADGTFYGTIGGGIMEHKLVEKAKVLLRQKDQQVLLIRQYHDKVNSNQSGMICSGSQVNAFIPLTFTDKQTIEKIASLEKKNILLSPAGIKTTEDNSTGLQYRSDEDWIYIESAGQQPVLHIFGGGHVSLALSELMRFLGFYIKVYDDRYGLNTMEANSFAHEKHFVDYNEIATQTQMSDTDHVVIMTIGYRTDKLVLKQLLHIPFAYIGLLGSEHKVNTLFDELRKEGIQQMQLNKVHAPIGININSKTTAEIAISIAAEIIKKKNEGLPSGRGIVS